MDPYKRDIVLKVLEIGRTYSREEITAMLGGNSQQFLPMRDGKVVCGCFRCDLNPQAPQTILVGKGKQRERSAEQAVHQKMDIPIFMRLDTRSWSYIGQLRPTRYQTTGPELHILATAAGREPIAGILYLERADNSSDDRQASPLTELTQYLDREGVYDRQ